jgi:hypothetical protein
LLLYATQTKTLYDLDQKFDTSKQILNRPPPDSLQLPPDDFWPSIFGPDPRRMTFDRRTPAGCQPNETARKPPDR